MSVVLGKRSLSKIEVIEQARQLTEELTKLSIRSFGLYSRKSPLRRKYSNLEHLLAENQLNDIFDEKKRLLDSLGEEVYRLVNAANTIYPRTKNQLKLRASYQNEALANCVMIKAELNKIAAFFNLDIHFFKESIYMLDREMHLIREWRKSDRNRFAKLFA